VQELRGRPVRVLGVGDRFVGQQELAVLRAVVRPVGTGGVVGVAVGLGSALSPSKRGTPASVVVLFTPAAIGR
jgi:hypothetical protein